MAGPEFKVTPLAARLGAVVDGRGWSREGRLGRWMGREQEVTAGKRSNERGAE